MHLPLCVVVLPRTDNQRSPLVGEIRPLGCQVVTSIRVQRLIGAPVRIKLRTHMLLRFLYNFVRLEGDLQILNVPQTCACLTVMKCAFPVR
jgi:hypothetical protein